MTDDLDTDTPAMEDESDHHPRRARGGEILLDQRLERMERTMERMEKKLAGGIATNANIMLRLAILEKIVYGMVGIILITVLVAVLMLVVRQSGSDHPAAVAASHVTAP